MGVTKAHDQVNFLHRHVGQAFASLIAHADAQLLHHLNHVMGDDRWPDARAKDSRPRRRQVFGAGFSDLAPAGVVIAQEENVSFDGFAAHDDLLSLIILIWNGSSWFG